MASRAGIPVLMVMMSVAAWSVPSSILGLQGIPLQMDWVDVNGDGRQELVALMRVVSTQAEVDTYLVGQSLRGLYEEKAVQESYLVTCEMRGDRWEEVWRKDLGRRDVIGFVVEKAPDARLHLWDEAGMANYAWQRGGWVLHGTTGYPERLLSVRSAFSQFPFWVGKGDEARWLIPDAHGIHVVGQATEWLPYPWPAESRVDRNRGMHLLTVPLPDLLDVDHMGQWDLVFSHGEEKTVVDLAQLNVSRSIEQPGRLRDMDGDGLADLVVMETRDEDLESMRDLRHLQSRLQVFIAREAFQFSARPDVEQTIQGLAIESEDGLSLPSAFLHLDGDSRVDLASVAIKLSALQVAKLVSLGRMKITFLLFLYRQDEAGRFQMVGQEPFDVEWRLNVRRLSLPAFPQLLADLNGDGTKDLFVRDKRQIRIHPITDQGIDEHGQTRVEIPRVMMEPTEILASDLDGDGSDELLVLRVDRMRTFLKVLRGGA